MLRNRVPHGRQMDSRSRFRCWCRKRHPCWFRRRPNRRVPNGPTNRASPRALSMSAMDPVISRRVTTTISSCQLLGGLPEKSPRGCFITAAHHNGRRTASRSYSRAIETGDVVALTDRNGPDGAPVVSPDGKKIAYLSYEDKVRTYLDFPQYV